ncbi:hypothetical protein CTI12_AA381110 [Artemisia annua]|uniref:Uncharacterized protein n=1 Tax=Artemisia annua TaxID=35608 RepID=A0A2U1MH17_ARTAN|nr:hypothetical protein CTI12_AA381110 [Artemisia annua]
MREDLKYVHSLEEKFDEKCLMLDIQKEFFINQIESFKSESVSHENVNENFVQTSSLKSENLYLKNKITELSKEAADVKEELSKRTAQFEKDLAKLEAQRKEKIFEDICDDTNIKFDFDELDIKNIELEHDVASLQKEKEHLKVTYKNLFDSIKRLRAQNQISNKSDSQIVPNHPFEKEKSVLKKKIVELEKMVAHKTKDFGDAKNDFSIEIEKYEKYFAHLENQNDSLHAKLASSDHPSLQKEYNDLRTSYNALKAKFDVLNRSKGKSHVSNESKPEVCVSEKVNTGESSKPFLKKVSQFTTYSLQKGRKFSKRPNFSETFTSQKKLQIMAPYPPCTSEGQKYDVFKTWPELLGVTGYDVCKVIEKWNSNIKVVPIVWNMIRPMDWYTNRVWVNLDKPDGVVVEVPKIG